MPVDSTKPEYNEFIERWQRCRDAFEGGDAVKKAGITYLPKLGSHKDYPQEYEAYKKRAEFYNATARTVEGLAGMMLQKSPNVIVPDIAKAHTKDITLSGISIEGFADMVSQETLLIGRSGILVDMPEDVAPGARPYWALYKAEDILSWKTKRIAGVDTLMQVVLREMTDVDGDDEFEVKQELRCRVLKIEGGIYQQDLWRKKIDSKANEWEIEKAGITPTKNKKPLTFIPFVFIGPNTTGAAIEKSPLLDLVDMNLSHYRTMADLEHGRHLTALPTPWVAGMQKPKKGEEIDIGSQAIWFLDTGGEAGMLEYTGQGLGALERADDNKRLKMASLGARLIEAQDGPAETATTTTMRHSGEHASLRRICQSVEAGMTMALRWHCWWFGAGIDLKAPKSDPSKIEASIEFNKEFFGVKISAPDLATLLAMLQAETISYKTFYQALQTGGFSRDGVDSDQELEDIDEDADRFAPEPPPELVPDEDKEPGDKKPGEKKPGKKKPKAKEEEPPPGEEK